MLDLKYTNVSSYDSLSAEEQTILSAYIYGMIAGALNMQHRFAVFELVGGHNADWSNTPLHYIYQYNYDIRADIKDATERSKKAVQQAGKDVGLIFKNLMIQDKFHKYKVVGKIQRRFPTNLYEYDTPQINSWVVAE